MILAMKIIINSIILLILLSNFMTVIDNTMLPFLSPSVLCLRHLPTMTEISITVHSDGFVGRPGRDCRFEGF